MTNEPQNENVCVRSERQLNTLLTTKVAKSQKGERFMVFLSGKSLWVQAKHFSSCLSTSDFLLHALLLKEVIKLKLHAVRSLLEHLMIGKHYVANSAGKLSLQLNPGSKASFDAIYDLH